MQRALVTGGSGFIGTHLVAALLATQKNVLNLDVAAPKLLDHAPCWRQTDILDEVSLRETVKQYKPTIIYNLAAVADLSKTAEGLIANTRGLTNVISANLALPTPALLVHASTQFVVRPQYSPQHARDYAPYTEYGASKAQSEELLWNAPEHMSWTIVRPTTVWGPWHPTFARSIWRYIRKRWYLLPTGIDPIRSYGYVGNVVAQLLAIPTVQEHAIQKMIFYVGDQPIRSSIWLDGFSRALTGRPVRRVPRSLLRLAASAGEISGRLGGPSPINLERLYRMSTDYKTPMMKTFDLLGHGPFSIEDGIEITTSWLKWRTAHACRGGVR